MELRWTPQSRSSRRVVRRRNDEGAGAATPASLETKGDVHERVRDEHAEGNDRATGARSHHPKHADVPRNFCSWTHGFPSRRTRAASISARTAGRFPSAPCSSCGMSGLPARVPASTVRALRSAAGSAASSTSVVCRAVVASAGRAGRGTWTACRPSGLRSHRISNRPPTSYRSRWRDGWRTEGTPVQRAHPIGRHRPSRPALGQRQRHSSGSPHG